MTTRLWASLALYATAIVLCLVAAHLALSLAQQIPSLSFLADLLGRIPGAGS